MSVYAGVCASSWEIKCVHKRSHQYLFVFVCVLMGGRDIYTPYCPFSHPQSTHHNCQYLVRYEEEKGGKKRAHIMDITAVHLWGFERWI